MNDAAISAAMARLVNCLRIDRHRLKKRLGRLKKSPSASQFSQIVEKIDESERIRAARAAMRPQISYPEALPVADSVAEIGALIEANPVVIVCGETGSGKSTQLPKLCLALGRGVDACIAHTQPRRLAARALANRVAEELSTPLGDVVGFRVRFEQAVRAQARVQFVTDGLLLSELAHDRFLDRYDTVIVDEAHERSLNIDLLLGHLKSLVKRRRDLRVIVTSATIDTERLSEFFGGAPVIEVSGRTFPVDVHYRPLLDEKGRELKFDAITPDVLNESILAALEEAFGHGDGDALVFLPGEREIRALTDEARKRFGDSADVLPLFARLDRKDQDRVFKPGKRRRIVVSTNVAETSVTVPRIRFVIDSGIARINRYNPGRRIQRLAVERISRAAADQRKGRSGRVRAGHCIRLYSEEDFLDREAYTDPEILRSSLADVILRLGVLGLGGIEQFDFVDPPDRRRIKDGYRLLEELGAVDSSRAVTGIGRQLAKIPIDVRLGRMLIAAEELNAVREIVVLAAVLSLPDPRIVPSDRVEQARKRHREIENKKSDFLTLLDFDRSWSEISGERVTSRRSRFCRDNFLSFMRMLEWSDLKRILMRHVKNANMTLNTEPASHSAVHRAVLAGFLANVAIHDDGGSYRGTHGKKLKIHPGSALAGRAKGWIVAAELAETGRLYARTVAPVDARWIERAATIQIKKSYGNPRWDRRRGAVYADEQVSLYGLTLVHARPIQFSKIDPAVSRRVFIDEALVEGAFDTDDAWYLHNQNVIAEVESLEARFRRRDLRADDAWFHAFYDQRLPRSVNGRESFNRWWRKKKTDDPDALKIALSDALQGVDLDLAARPLAITNRGLDVALEYRFEPGAPDDGVGARLPLSYLNHVESARFDWLVPGMLREKLVALCKLLPKQTRIKLVPVPDTIDRVLESIQFAQGDLVTVLSDAIAQIKGIRIPLEAWRPSDLEPIHHMHFRVLGAKDEVLASGRDLAKLRSELGAEAREQFSASGAWEIEREGVRVWDFGDLPERIERRIKGQTMVGFPSIVDAGTTCAIRVFDSAEAARDAHEHGVRNLLLLQTPSARRRLNRQMPEIEKMCLLYLPLGPCSALREQLIRASVERAAGAHPLDTRSEAVFAQMANSVTHGLMESLQTLCQTTLQILTLWRDVRVQIDSDRRNLPVETIADVEAQLAHLLSPEFVLRTPAFWLDELPRILNAVKLRLSAARVDPRRDLARQAELAACAKTCSRYQDAGLPAADLIEMSWLFEELRVSTYAQSLGTTKPISPIRLQREWQRRLKSRSLSID